MLAASKMLVIVSAGLRGKIIPKCLSNRRNAYSQFFPYARDTPLNRHSPAGSVVFPAILSYSAPASPLPAGVWIG